MQNETKPALQSKTVRTGLTLILVTIWQPLVMLVGALLTVVGVQVDTAAWIPYAADGAIGVEEWLSIVRDVALPLIGLLVIRYRTGAKTAIQGWISQS